MFDRIMGIVTLKAPTYKAVAEDEAATKQAMMIVIVVALIQGFVVGLFSPEGGVSLVGGLVRAVISLVLGLVTWYVAAWLLATASSASGALGWSGASVTTPRKAVMAPL